ncbi:anaerobic benzoate catabolism transcriptional regulator [Eubacteriaceae bacterium CHKCI005]|uniref:HTH cro/C1-type domain-containing protein n=2 Tax=Solibaculum mannosilyticum TaxID=2780922 RepID=A0A7I8D3N2_9FIRM|nr:hypothetical protein C12CBH8_20700 [Solibaculum mannosilyticum]CZT55801.1 anaerobic benzoate catabolism transcriptional regulator [Eubacteriaceae bacterium CHKCI005]
MNFYNIGKRVKYFREQAGMTQAQLAEKMDKTPHHITQIERGLSLPGLMMFYNLAQLFGVPTDSFFMDEDKLRAQFALLEVVGRLDRLRHDEIIRAFEALYAIKTSFEMGTSASEESQPQDLESEQTS